MFFERAKVGLNEWWRYLAGSVLIFGGWQTVAMLPLIFLFAYIAIKGGHISTNYVKAASEVGVGNNVTLSLTLLTFFLACVILYLVVRFLHKKPFLSILSSRERFSWKRAAFGFGLWFLLGAVLFFVGYQNTPEEYTFSFNLTNFISLLIVCLVLLPFQTSFEELFFRGYATQALGLITGSRLIALVIPSVIFGLLHSVNPEVIEHGFFKMMPFYIGMGIFLGIMTIMDEGIELPLGVHFANNFTAAVLVNMENSALPTDALFMAKSYDPTEDIPYALAMMATFLVLAAIVFKWKDWGKLIRNIK